MITPEHFNQMQARCAAGRDQSGPVAADAVDNQAALHDEILAECRRRLWPVIPSRMDMASTTAKGAAGFVIAASGGRVFFIECKTRTGKLTTEQLGFKAMLERNSHRLFVVRSFNDFLNVAEFRGIHLIPKTGPA